MKLVNHIVVAHKVKCEEESLETVEDILKKQNKKFMIPFLHKFTTYLGTVETTEKVLPLDSEEFAALIIKLIVKDAHERLLVEACCANEKIFFF